MFFEQRVVLFKHVENIGVFDHHKKSLIVCVNVIGCFLGSRYCRLLRLLSNIGVRGVIGGSTIGSVASFICYLMGIVDSIDVWKWL